MIIGKIDRGDETIRFDIDLRCTDCKKSVPGGMKTSKKYYQTEQFKIDLRVLKEGYLCGICRDRHRTRQKKIK